MQIEITNLGAVKHLVLDLDKPLTILCGANNSGKTYVANTVYGLMGFKFSIPFKLLKDIFEDLRTNGSAKIDLIKLLTDSDGEYFSSLCQAYTENLHTIFGGEKLFFADTKINVSIKKVRIPGSKFLSLKMHESTPHRMFQGYISGVLNHSLFPKTYMAVAERTAINLFSKELSLNRNALVNELLEEGTSDPRDLLQRRATRYSQPIKDSLEIAEDLSNFKKRNSEFYALADEIEQEILKGVVTVSEMGEVQFSPAHTAQMQLPVHLAASLIKSLSHLVIYFRHLATPNDFIIIDEPELNLHPDSQILVARILAKIVNKGFKVMISTHSDYIVRELNNLILLHKKPQFAAKYGYSLDCALAPESVQAILFDAKTGIPKHLAVDDTGFEVEAMDRIINDLNSRSQDLFFNDSPDDSE